MGQDPTKKKYDARGPYSPPLPAEAEQKEGEPMAVANDKQTTQGESFVPTTAPTDRDEVMNEDLARQYGQRPARTPTPHGKRASERRDEDAREQREPSGGYGRVLPDGFRELADEDSPSASVAAKPPRDVGTDEDESRAS